MFDRENYIYTKSINKAAYVVYYCNTHVDIEKYNDILYFVIENTEENMKLCEEYYETVHKQEEMYINLTKFNAICRMLKNLTKKFKEQNNINIK